MTALVRSVRRCFCPVADRALVLSHAAVVPARRDDISLLSSPRLHPLDGNDGADDAAKDIGNSAMPLARTETNLWSTTTTRADTAIENATPTRARAATRRGKEERGKEKDQFTSKEV